MAKSVMGLSASGWTAWWCGADGLYSMAQSFSLGRRLLPPRGQAPLRMLTVANYRRRNEDEGP